MIHPDFENWSRESLVQFAKESYDHLIDDTILINALKQDLKAAIKAYRQVNTRKHHDKEESQTNSKML
jgi:hypothetical protein